MDKPNIIEYSVFGRYALFTDPLFKTGGEKFSYQIPTYQALKGITESIYWKPTITWVIDECRIMNPIQTESKGIRPIKYNNGGNDLSYYTYLRNVEYRVKAHFEWNENRKDLSHDRNENKHYDIARRMVERGGRRDIFLGTRECQGYVEPCAFDEGKGAYDDTNLLFGIMLHGITYPDEAIREEEKGKMTVRLWNAQLVNGVVNFPRPEECEIRHVLRDAKEKQFVYEKNFKGLKEFEGGDLFGMVKDFG
ncbi:MAG: type I-C CRISPR-associated protein Cas5c [Ruminococcus flavefaciens]|nr:type I-C CRISPR-associated protein Cas5c [Ruminococcus flavefaciens]